jgi:hypothetical protein
MKIVVLILFAVHLLTCCWYAAGNNNQTLDNGVDIQGWVSLQPWNATCGESCEILVGERYLTSMYYVLNALENGDTNYEKLAAVFGELVLGFIYGALAGLMSTVMLGAMGQEQVTGDRIKALKQWMQDKKTSSGHQLFPASYKKGMLRYFLRLWTKPHLQSEKELLQQMSPTMASELRQMLYEPFLMTIPLFRGLSKEVHVALAEHVQPTIATANTVIVSEGQSGTDMYMIISGEVEVSKELHRSRDNPDGRLGYLSTGGSPYLATAHFVAHRANVCCH